MQLRTSVTPPTTNNDILVQLDSATSDAAPGIDPIFVVRKNFYSSIEEALNQSDVVSFDVFDTLVRRPFLKPTHLFDYVGENFNKDDFSHRRIAAEAAARRKYSSAIDVTLRQIYELIEGDPSEEIEWEKACIFPRPDLCQVLDLARRKGKGVIAISDIYLPAEVVRDLLTKCGIVVDELIVSSAHDVAKFDGSSFRLAAKKCGVDLGRMIHFGDNAISDFDVPGKLGMKAVLVGDWTSAGMECALTDNLLSKLAYSSNRSSTVGAAIRDLRFEYGHKEYWSDLGRYHVGPLVYGFTRWIEDFVKSHEIENVLFIARDGWLPFKAFQNLNSSARSSYAYLSRALLVQASLGSLPEPAVRQLVSGIPAPVSDYIRRIGLPADDLLEAARVAFKGDPLIRSEADRERLSEFFAHHRSQLAQMGKKPLEHLQQYLDELGAFRNPERVALVDVGWSGSSASLLCELFPEARRWNYLFWGTLDKFQPRDIKHYAYFFQFGEPMHHSVLVFECVEILELFFTSSETSVIGLEVKNGVLAPVFAADTDKGAGRKLATRGIEEGVMQCIAHFASIQDQLPNLRIDRHAIYIILENILRASDDKTVVKLGGIWHQLGMGDSQAELLLPDLNNRYWPVIWRWLRGKRIKSGTATVFWPHQQEQHFIASQKGIKQMIARRAFRIMRRGGLLGTSKEKVSRRGP